MSDRPKTAATRLCQDRVQLREQERNEAQTRARVAEEKVAFLTVENERRATESAHLKDQNDRLAAEIVRLRGGIAQDPARGETELQMAALRDALLALLDKQPQDRK